MKLRKYTTAAALLTSAAMFNSAPHVYADEPKIALVGGTVINPGDGTIIENAIITIERGMIVSVESAKEKAPPPEQSINATGKFILPGYIDTHIHFFQSGGLFTRPDAVNLNSVRPYKDEVAWIKSHLDETFARYLQCGITSVIDVGGPMLNFGVRKRANTTANAPRVAIAGPLISSVARPQLDLGDPPIVKIDTPEQGRRFVRKLAAQKPDYIKIWYVVSPDSPVEKFRPVVHAVIE
nr:amidohydrolase [Chthoniobacterales bacterium]